MPLRAVVITALGAGTGSVSTLSVHLLFLMNECILDLMFRIPIEQKVLFSSTMFI